MLVGEVKALAKKATDIAQNNHPETSGLIFVVNAPWAFTAVFTMVKGWLDEKTVKKIHVKGSDYKAKLLEFVDEEFLPDFLGGKCTQPLHANDGPWRDFEIVDGHKKDDVVGIRKKGETGPPIFTP